MENLIPLSLPLSFPPLPYPSFPFSPSLPPFSNSNSTTSLRITRQKKTLQNLNLSKQAEDPWAPIGRCSPHPHHQGAGHSVGGPLPMGEGNGWGWAKGEPEVCLLVTCLPVGVFLIQQELVNQKDCPYMCAYKLVTVKFKWWGLQNKVENFIHKVSDQGKAFPVCMLVGCFAQEIIQSMGLVS